MRIETDDNMKKQLTLPTLLLAALTYPVFGQSSFLTGKIVEESTKLPLEFVHVSLLNSNDTTPVTSALTDRVGAFKLAEVLTGSYRLSISIIGFETHSSAVFSVKGNTDLGIFSLKPAAILLKETEVAAEKSTYLQTIDRKIYYPEKDIAAQTSSASEILQNIPSVSVDIDGVVSLRGSANITFLINGKPSGLMNRSSASFLQQMPANTIERIEIITNPSAKYRPDGTAGIINIVLKKNTKRGFNGTLITNASTHDRYNGSLSLNYNPGKINLFGTYGYRQNWFPRDGADFRITTDSTGAQTSFEIRSTALGRPRSHTANVGLDYALNAKNKIGLSGAYFTFYQERTINISTLQRNATDVLQDYKTARNELEDEKEFEGSATWEHQFNEEDHTLQLEVGFSNYAELEESRYDDTFLVPDFPVLQGHNTIQKSGHTTSVTAEYAKPIGEDMELEAGYEGEFFQDDLDYSSERFDPISLLWMPETGRTNRFLFRQDVHALFGTLSREIEDFNILAGLRAEQTFISSNLLTLDSMIPNNYFKLFPTLHFGWEISDEAELALSYSRRVNRPDSDELNPFPEYKDPRNFEAGNPDLKPEQIHAVELGYQWKKDGFNFLPSLYYRYEYDAFTEISRYINDTTLLTTFDNLSSNQSAGLELVLAWKLKNRLSLNLSSNTFWNTIDASNLGFSAKKSTVSSEVKLAVGWNLTQRMKLQANANYRSAFLTVQGKSLPNYFLNAGLRQDLFQKKASLTLTVSDVFNTMRWAWKINTPELQVEGTRKRKSQIVYLGFIWRFGVSGKKVGDDLMFEDKL